MAAPGWLAAMGRAAAVAGLAALAGCGDAAEAGGAPRASSAASASAASASAGGGGHGGGASGTSVEAILDELREDRDAALLAHAARTGWPVPVDGGYLFVSTSATLRLLAGDHDGWTGAEMTSDAGFHWIVLNVPAGARYKLTDRTAWAADPWSRAITYDAFGEMSLVAPSAAHLERHFGVGDAAMEPRTVRVWVPEGDVERVLYVHDGQNLFDPAGPAGGWHLQDHAPPGVLLVGIDSTAARLSEYTHVTDRIEDGGALIGGMGDAYADFVRDTVRPLIRARYGEPGPVGIMGSSLGGLISFHAADRHRGEYAFAASLSGTMGWGSIGAGVRHETMIERYAAHAEPAAALYLDSGGGGDCVDDDGDGIEDDDPAAADNYCENRQLRGTLAGARSPYVEGESVFYAWHPGAEHDEAAWAARVAEPLRIFEAL
ncbi:alpha/beta hydrolase-fold protein [Sorangium sp. So ce296]|uniref:alpha/beta hydrolase n=1 Tax=Sorangium sp. So ce296 TaxID=3133296 RepID=UPI003F5DA415